MINKNSQKNRTADYFENLGSLYQSITVTQRNGDRLQLDTALEEFIQQVISTHQQKNKIIFIGNGGSSTIASHMAIDYWKNGGLRAICFNDAAQLTCLGNDYGYEYIFEKPIQMFAEPNDLLVAISSSGKSPNILNGVKAAEQKDCKIITLSGFGEENPLRKMGAINFYLPSHSYGFVEITHLAICHAVLDLAMEEKNGVPYAQQSN